MAMFDAILHENNSLIAENERLRDENKQMRGLLSMLASDEAEPVFALNQEQNDGFECLRCDTWVYSYEPDHFLHAPECPWLRARAFLDEHPGPA